MNDCWNNWLKWIILWTQPVIKGLVGLKKALSRVFWIVSDRMCRHSSFSFFIRLLRSIKFSLFPISRVPNGDIWTQFPSIYSGDGSFLILSSSLSLSYIILLGPRTGCQENLSVCFFFVFFFHFFLIFFINFVLFFFFLLLQLVIGRGKQKITTP